MFQRKSSSLVSASLVTGIAALILSLLSGCGVGTAAGNVGPPDAASTGNLTMGGILHGGPNPISGATITLYVTSGSTYGATATAVATTTTGSNGSFTLTLPTATVACPAGEYAYVGAWGGSTGGASVNHNSLLMVPVGACSSNYTVSGTGPYVNTYTGSALWIDEITTAASAYALGNFTSVNCTTSSNIPTGCAINIGAPANNTSTALVGSTSVAPEAAGLAHAFANALALVNTNTGQPNTYMYSGGSGGVIPKAELFLLGNLLQACVNSTGTTSTNTGTSNDGSGCGQLFSFVTPPSGVSGSTTPNNTLSAMLDLAKYPNPSVNTWPSNCMGAAGSGTTTATACIFNLAQPSGAYTGALTSAPPDWALAVVYTAGYGANSTATACTASPNCPGLTYPFYVALDYQDNIYVLNYDSLNSSGTPPTQAATWTNIIGIGNNGAPIFATPEDTAHLAIVTIATDLAGHVVGGNATSSSTPPVLFYNTTTGAVTSVNDTNNYPVAIAIDPFNNVYVASYTDTINLRKFAYNAGSYTVSSYSAVGTPSDTYGAPFQIAFDSHLDLYEFLDPNYGGTAGTTPYVCLLNNQSNSTYTYMSAAPTPAYTNCQLAANTAVALTGSDTSTSPAAGIGVTSTDSAMAIDNAGISLITKSTTTNSKTATITGSSPYAIAPVNSTSGLLSRYMSVDGNNWAYSVDGAGGSVPSGVSVFDSYSTDLLNLGTYKGCFVNGTTCGTAVTPGGGTGQAPMYSPRSSAIDSSGDIWVVSGNAADLTELIGAAAPTWPGLSMAKFGLPQ